MTHVFVLAALLLGWLARRLVRLMPRAELLPSQFKPQGYRPSFRSTLLRLLPTFLTTFFTAERERPVLFDS